MRSAGPGGTKFQPYPRESCQVEEENRLGRGEQQFFWLQLVGEKKKEARSQWDARGGTLKKQGGRCRKGGGSRGKGGKNGVK